MVLEINLNYLTHHARMKSLPKKKKKERQAEDFGKLCAESLQQTAGRTAGL